MTYHSPYHQPPKKALSSHKIPSESQNVTERFSGCRALLTRCTTFGFLLIWVLLLLVPCGLARWMLRQNCVREQNDFVRLTWNLNVLANYFWSNSWHAIERNSTKQITQCCSNLYIAGETHKNGVSFTALFWRGVSRLGGDGCKVPLNAGQEIRLSAYPVDFFEHAYLFILCGCVW